MILKINYIKLNINKMKFLSMILFLILIDKGNFQTAYPVMKAGTITFSSTSASDIYNITYTASFSATQTPQCTLAISGFDFSSNLYTAPYTLAFLTFVNSCQLSKISLSCTMYDAFLVSLKASYFAIYNDQTATLVVFQIFTVVNSTTGAFGSLGTPNGQPSRQYTFSNPFSSAGLSMSPQSSTLTVFVCLQGLSFGTTQIFSYQFYASYNNALSTLSTTITLGEFTYIDFLSLQTIMFNRIQQTSSNHFYTYSGSTTFFPEGPTNYDTNIKNFDQNYLYSVEALTGLYLDCSNISILIGGSSLKNWQINYNSSNILSFTSNFLLNSNSFTGSQVMYWYFAFTKYVGNGNSNKADHSSTSQNNKGIQIAQILGPILVFIVIITLICYFCRHLRKKVQNQKKAPEMQTCENIQFQ